MNPPHASQATTRWGALLSVVGLGVAISIQLGKVPAALTTLAAEFGQPLAGVTLLVSVFALLSGSMGLPLGLVAARLGARRALLLGGAVGSLAAMASAAAPGFGTLLVARVFEGLGFLLIASSGPGIIAAVAAPRHRNAAMALWGSYMPMGAALGLGSALVVEAAGWRVAWWLTAGVMVVALLVAATSLRGVEGLARRGVPLGEALRGVLGNRAALAIALCFAAYNGVYFPISVLLPAALAENFGWGVAAAGYAGAAVVLGNGLGNLLAGVLFHRGLAPARLLLPALSALGVLAALVFLAPVAPLMVLLAFMASTLGGMVPAVLFATLPALVPPSMTPAAMGMLIQANNLVQLTVPLAMAVLAGFGWFWLAPFMLGFAVLAALLGRPLYRR